MLGVGEALISVPIPFEHCYFDVAHLKSTVHFFSNTTRRRILGPPLQASKTTASDDGLSKDGSTSTVREMRKIHRDQVSTVIKAKPEHGLAERIK